MPGPFHDCDHTHAKLEALAEAAAAEDADGTEPQSGSFALQEDKLDSALRW